jgi:hypothetical protein
MTSKAISHYHGLTVREITISMQVAKLEAHKDPRVRITR